LADITSKNQLTGPQSLNKNITKINRDLNVKVLNVNHEDNYVDFYLNTGKNDLFKNTKVEDVSTGSINARVALNNKSNVGGTSGSTTGTSTQSVLSGAASDPVLSNAITGPESANINKVALNTSRNLEIKNIADINNDVDINANTGKNDVMKNTVVGDVSTGNINVAGSINNVANSDQCITCPDLLGLFNGSGSGAANVSSDLSNSTTGPDSVNINKVKVNDYTNVEVKNIAHIDNNVDVYANTGHNDVVKNTVVGDVSTGNVSVDFAVTNQAN
jgi:hypothetical protein